MNPITLESLKKSNPDVDWSGYDGVSAIGLAGIVDGSSLTSAYPLAVHVNSYRFNFKARLFALHLNTTIINSAAYPNIAAPGLCGLFFMKAAPDIASLDQSTDTSFIGHQTFRNSDGTNANPTNGKTVFHFGKDNSIPILSGQRVGIWGSGNGVAANMIAAYNATIFYFMDKKV